MSFHMLVETANQLSNCSLLVQAKGSSNILQIILVYIRSQWGSEYFVEGWHAAALGHDQLLPSMPAVVLVQPGNWPAALVENERQPQPEAVSRINH